MICGRLYLRLLIHWRVRIIGYSYSPVRVVGRVKHQEARCIILQICRMLVWLLLLQKHGLHWMLLLLHDLFLVVAEMIVIHHVILFPARSDDWRRQWLLDSASSHHRRCRIRVWINLPALGAWNLVAYKLWRIWCAIVASLIAEATSEAMGHVWITAALTLHQSVDCWQMLTLIVKEVVGTMHKGSK